MKRSEMEIKIQEKLRKQKHLFDTYRDNPDKMPFDCLIGNLCGRVLTEVESQGMLPPVNKKEVLKENYIHSEFELCTWEDEDDD